MILASNSPRRKEILNNFGLKVKVKTKNIEEISNKENYIDIAMDIAHKKGVEISIENPQELVISADTIVVYDNKIMGKPKDKEDARRMLKQLSGRAHEVVTAFGVFYKEKNIEYTEACVTKVIFKELTEDEIEWYLDTGDPMDKAGAYGIQAHGNILIKEIKGDFFNVMGFPLSMFYDTLKKHNINLLHLLR